MKTTYWFIFSALLSTSLLAQQATNAPAPAPIETPAPASALSNAPPADPTKTNAPAAQPEKKKAAKKKAEKKAVAKKKDAAAELKSEPLVAGPATVVASNVNVRGQAKLKSEIVTRINKGQAVTVLEEVTLKDSGPEEPSAWAKILLPPGAHVWANTAFIDSANKTVRPKKLNVRSGPGENYSVLGVLNRGDAVKEIGSKGDWTEIEPPSGAYAFVAAQYLKQEAPGTIGAAPETAPVPATVTEAPTLAAAPAETPTPQTNAPATPIATNAPPTTADLVAAIEGPLPKRIVQREGIVRGTFSIQAPTKFELANPDNGRTINYLYTTAPDLDLKRYKGMRIVVTGEEGLDERWRNTPIITIEKIQVVE